MYLESVSVGLKLNDDMTTYREEQIGDFLLILSPGLAVLSTTPRDISLGTVDDHDHEEDKVKPRKGASERIVSNCNGQASGLSLIGRAAYLNPVMRPQDIEKNMSGT
jgi:hypothetical protein